MWAGVEDQNLQQEFAIANASAIEAIGRADMARNLQNLNNACAELAPGVSVQDCFAKMSSNKPRVDSVQSARDQLQETRKFIVGEDLVSIPGTEEA